MLSMAINKKDRLQIFFLAKKATKAINQLLDEF